MNNRLPLEMPQLTVQRPNVAIDVKSGYFFDLDKGVACIPIPKGADPDTVLGEFSSSMLRSGNNFVAHNVHPSIPSLYVCQFGRSEVVDATNAVARQNYLASQNSSVDKVRGFLAA